MATYDGSIRINTAINTRGFDRGVSHLRDGMVSIGNSMSRIIKTFGFGLGIAGLVSLGKQAIDTASDIQEVQNVVDTAFGDMSYKMERFADTAVTQFGISKLSAKEMGSTFMAMGRSMISSMEEASDMAINLTARAADMSSFYNKSIEETSTALKSIYTGETESLKEYGVVMTQVNLQEFARQQGINKSIQAMTQAEKVQLQYAYVMKQTSLAAGDFAKTSDSWANQTRILSEQFKELLSVIGSGLITVFTPVIKFLNTVLSLLITIAKQIGAVLSALFNISIPTADSGKFAQDMNAAAGGADEFADGMKKAGKAADKTKGKLASFDKLEVLKKDSGGSGGGAGVGGGAGLAGNMLPEISTTPGMEKVDSWADGLREHLKPVLDYFQKLKDIFSQGFWDGLGDWEYRWDSIKESIASIKNSLIDIFTDPEVLAAGDRWAQSVVYLIGSIVGSLASIGLTIATNVLGGISKYLEENKDRIKKFLVSIFDIEADINYLLADFFQSFAYVFEAFASEDGQRLTANLIGIFANAFMGVSELVLKLARDILNIFIEPFVENKEAFRTALEGFLGVLADVAGTIKQGIDDTFDKLNEVYDAHFRPFFDSVAQGLTELVGQFLEFWNGNVQPILNQWAVEFDSLWTGHIQPFINNFIELFGGIADLLKSLWESILKPFISWLIDSELPRIVAFLGFLGDSLILLLGVVADFASGIIDRIQNILNFLTNVFEGNWKAIWDDIVNYIASPLAKKMNEAGINLIEGIKNGISSAWESLKELISRVAESIKERFCSLLGIHSPSTVFAEIGGFLIQGLANGISSTIELVTSIIGGLVDGILGMFSFDKWSEAGQGMIQSIVSVIQTFRETWNESFSEWMEENQEFYFGYDIWYEQFSNILTAYTDMFAEFSAQWQADMDAWWNTMVMPFFDLAQWTLFGTQMKNGILTGLKAIVNEIGGLLNKIIGMFNSAFKELEESMNDLISDYNKSAKELGTSTLSKVKYSPMASIKVPALADGSVIRGGNPFLAILGDQRYGQTNIEAPIGTIKQAVREEMMDMGHVGSRSGSVPVTINLNYNGETFARLSIPDILSELNRQGYDITSLMGNG